MFSVFRSQGQFRIIGVRQYLAAFHQLPPDVSLATQRLAQLDGQLLRLRAELHEELAQQGGVGSAEAVWHA